VDAGYWNGSIVDIEEGRLCIPNFLNPSACVVRHWVWDKFIPYLYTSRVSARNKFWVWSWPPEKKTILFSGYYYSTKQYPQLFLGYAFSTQKYPLAETLTSNKMHMHFGLWAHSHTWYTWLASLKLRWQICYKVVHHNCKIASLRQWISLFDGSTF
jgi:hypothetical protein